ncbi:MAG: nucleotidyltransferase domain-containing protein [Actinomycetota bacterium]
MSGPSASLIERIVGLTRDDAIAAMLFGSCARGDAGADSDVDVLQLVSNRPGTAVRDELTIVSYTPDVVKSMVRRRSLFTWHLHTEGIYIFDPSSVLRLALDAHPGPDPRYAIDRLRILSAVLDVDGDEFLTVTRGLSRVARFLLRTALYAAAFEAGTGTFNLKQAATAADSSGHTWSVLTRLSSTPTPEWQTIVESRELLADLVGILQDNPYGSLEAMAVRTETIDPELHALCLHAIADDPSELDYASTQIPVL